MGLLVMLSGALRQATSIVVHQEEGRVGSWLAVGNEAATGAPAPSALCEHGRRTASIGRSGRIVVVL